MLVTHSRQHHTLITHHRVHSFRQLGKVLHNRNRWRVSLSLYRPRHDSLLRVLQLGWHVETTEHHTLCQTGCSFSPSTRRSLFTTTTNVDARPSHNDRQSLTRLLWDIAERAAQSHFAIEEGDLTGECLQKRALRVQISPHRCGWEGVDVVLTLPDPTGPMMQMRSPGWASKMMFVSVNDACCGRERWGVGKSDGSRRCVYLLPMCLSEMTLEVRDEVVFIMVGMFRVRLWQRW